MSVNTLDRRSAKLQNRFKRWLFEGLRPSAAGKSKVEHQAGWWEVMCLTGVDYFSTLGYQPGIAFLAAGLLSPIATLVLVILTLFGALPVYRAVAQESPQGQGSVSMLERLLPGWRGKTLVLILLGFAATDFIITITLSAADATAHVVENPMIQQLAVPIFHDRIAVTLTLLLMLGGIFLAGFREAIGVSVALVFVYLGFNAVALGVATDTLLHTPEAFANWHTKLFQAHGSIPAMIGSSLLLFPKLALGMSGFETGVAVMPLVKGDQKDNPVCPQGRIRNTQKLLLVAAMIMAAFLMVSSVATTLLIPPEAFKEGGEANGRAISFLAHKYLGHSFGSGYDISSILILWFAGASAMAGLLNLVPRYLPRYGMAPEWAGAMRPLVLFFTAVGFMVTILFRANVDAQAGAYATGVLVLMTSAALAVALHFWKLGKKQAWSYGVITIVFVYTSIVNMIERPEGLHIASFFIGTILGTSLISRAIRSLELRIQEVVLDPLAEEFLKRSLNNSGCIDLLAHRPGGTEYRKKEEETRRVHRLSKDQADFIFLEVNVSDASEFIGDRLEITGVDIDGFKVLRCNSPAIPNAIAAILMHLREKTSTIPHAYFGWTEGNPLGYVFKYIFLGEGETAPVTREILRELERNPEKRPRIHVG